MEQIHRDRIQKWVDALRSGEYTQARSTLATDKGHCCLGVACEVAIKDGLPLTKTRMTTCGFIFYLFGNPKLGGEGSSEVLPRTVQAYFGLPRGNPLVMCRRTWLGDKDENGMHERCLASLNDSGIPFEELADAIENTYLTPEDVTEDPNV